MSSLFCFLGFLGENISLCVCGNIISFMWTQFFSQVSEHLLQVRLYVDALTAAGLPTAAHV